MAQEEIEILREQIRQLWGAVISLQDKVNRLTERLGQDEPTPPSQNPTGDLGQ